MWEIIDNNGVIHSGADNVMIHAFDVMINPKYHSKEEIERWMTDWDGDIKLVQIHNISR